MPSKQESPTTTKKPRLLRSQRLGFPGTVVYVLLAQITCVFTSDMYMPAFPQMAEFFDVTPETISITLFAFFFCYPFGILIFGNFSDKFGRRPVMITASIIFTTVTLACLLVTDIYVFIALRVVEALAAGACMAVGLALVKDCFVESLRETIMLYVVAAFAIGPVLAPLVGGQMLLFAPWQAIFVVLALFGLVILGLSLVFQETLAAQDRTQEGFIPGFKRLVLVGRNKSFLLFLIVLTIYNYVPFIAYLGVSSYIYIYSFELTAQQYSYFFAATVAVSLLSVVIYKPLVRHFSYRAMTTGILMASLVSGVGIFIAGWVSPFLFNAFIIIYYLSSYLIKPYGVNTLLNLQEKDTGSASALYNFVGNFIGCFGILYMMLPWGDYFTRLGLITVLCTLVSMAAWFCLLRSDTKLPGIKDQMALKGRGTTADRESEDREQEDE